MKKLSVIIKPIAFLSILLLILHGLAPFFLQDGDAINSFQKSRGVFSQRENSIDILVLGDSESYTTVSPMEIWEQYGYTAYVSGLPARQVSDALEVLEEAIKQQHPKYVLLETNMLFRDKTNFYYGTSYLFDRYTLPFIPVFARHDAWKTMDFSTLKPCYEWRDPLKGYYINKKKVSYTGPKPSPTDKRGKLSKKNLSYIEQIKALCDENGSTLVMYSAPSMKNWTYEKHNRLVDLMQELGCEYVDLNLEDSIKIDWDNDTSDGGDHLNTFGAIKVSKYMGEYFDQKQTLKDKRNDASFADWNEDLLIYKEKK